MRFWLCERHGFLNLLVSRVEQFTPSIMPLKVSNESAQKPGEIDVSLSNSTNNIKDLNKEPSFRSVLSICALSKCASSEWGKLRRMLLDCIECSYHIFAVSETWSRFLKIFKKLTSDTFYRGDVHYLLQFIMQYHFRFFLNPLVVILSTFVTK